MNTRRRTSRRSPSDVESLVANNKGLAYLLAQKACQRTSVPLEELEAEALFWLWRAAVNFKPELGFRFSTYAFNCVRGGLIGFAQRERQHCERYSQLENGNTILDRPTLDPDTNEWARERAETVLAMMDWNSRSDVRRRFGIGVAPQSGAEIGRQRGVTRQAVNLSVRNAIVRVRYQFSTGMPASA